MVKLDDLYTVHSLALKNNRRGEDAVIFEVDKERRLRHQCQIINERTHEIYQSYAFINMRWQPREVFGFAQEKREIDFYVIWRLLPILEAEFCDRTFNSRKGKGVDAAVNQLAESIRKVTHNYTREAWVIGWDLLGCFPNANCDIACKQLQKLVLDKYTGEDKDDLLWMIEAAIYCNPQLHCTRRSPVEMWQLIDEAKSLFSKPEGTGGVIGSYIWQIAMILYFNDIDHWAVDDMGLEYIRFNDDHKIVVENKEGGLALLPLFREKYAKVGARMHPRKFSCQQASKGVRFLGRIIKGDRIYVDNRTIRRADDRICDFNDIHDKLIHIEEFISSINSTLGLLKNKNEFKNIQRLVDSISPKWWEYVDMDWNRLCIVAREGYKHKDIVKLKFNKVWSRLNNRLTNRKPS